MRSSNEFKRWFDDTQTNFDHTILEYFTYLSNEFRWDDGWGPGDTFLPCYNPEGESANPLPIITTKNHTYSLLGYCVAHASNENSRKKLSALFYYSTLMLRVQTARITEQGHHRSLLMLVCDHDLINQPWATQLLDRLHISFHTHSDETTHYFTTPLLEVIRDKPALYDVLVNRKKPDGSSYADLSASFLYQSSREEYNKFKEDRIFEDEEEEDAFRDKGRSNYVNKDHYYYGTYHTLLSYSMINDSPSIFFNQLEKFISYENTPLQIDTKTSFPYKIMVDYVYHHSLLTLAMDLKPELLQDLIKFKSNGIAHLNINHAFCYMITIDRDGEIYEDPDARVQPDGIADDHQTHISALMYAAHHQPKYLPYLLEIKNDQDEYTADLNESSVSTYFNYSMDENAPDVINIYEIPLVLVTKHHPQLLLSLLRHINRDGSASLNLSESFLYQSGKRTIEAHSLRTYHTHLTYAMMLTKDKILGVAALRLCKVLLAARYSNDTYRIDLNQKFLYSQIDQQQIFHTPVTYAMTLQSKELLTLIMTQRCPSDIKFNQLFLHKKNQLHEVYYTPLTFMLEHATTVFPAVFNAGKQAPTPNDSSRQINITTICYRKIYSPNVSVFLRQKNEEYNLVKFIAVSKMLTTQVIEQLLIPITRTQTELTQSLYLPGLNRLFDLAMDARTQGRIQTLQRIQANHARLRQILQNVAPTQMTPCSTDEDVLKALSEHRPYLVRQVRMLHHSNLLATPELEQALQPATSKCSICLEEVLNIEDAHCPASICNAAFHIACLQNWLSVPHAQCPACKGLPSLPENQGKPEEKSLERLTHRITGTPFVPQNVMAQLGYDDDHMLQRFILNIDIHTPYLGRIFLILRHIVGSSSPQYANLKPDCFAALVQCLHNCTSFHRLEMAGQAAEALGHCLGNQTARPAHDVLKTFREPLLELINARGISMNALEKARVALQLLG